MSYEDWKHSRSRDGESGGPDATSVGSVAPGKRTLTMSLPLRPAGAASPVQSKADSRAAPGGADAPAHTEQWLGVAMRPDLYSPPTQRNSTPPRREGSQRAQLPVQARGSIDAEEPDKVHGAASQGISGSSAPLPHLERIQSAFGSHDLSGIKAHVGGPAAQAGREINARAYAMGEHIAFAETPDLHTAAHEVAHVMQQRAGVQLAGGVGRPGDSYERQADAVADTVVAGGSADSIIGKVPSASQVVSTVQGKGIQRLEAKEGSASENTVETDAAGASGVPQAIIAHVKLREGWREDVYLDSLGKLTTGMGHLLTTEEKKKYKVGDKVPLATLEAWAQADVKKAYDAARAQASTLGVSDQSFVNALTSVNFQLGTEWYTIHKKTWNHLVAHQWEKAAVEAQDSQWYAQTPVRVQDFQAALRAIASTAAADTKNSNAGKTAGTAGNTDAASGASDSQNEPGLMDSVSAWLAETMSDVTDSIRTLFSAAPQGTGSPAQRATPGGAARSDFSAPRVRGCDYVVRRDQTIVYLVKGVPKREFPPGHELYDALKAEILEVYPQAPCWNSTREQKSDGNKGTTPPQSTGEQTDNKQTTATASQSTANIEVKEIQPETTTASDGGAAQGILDQDQLTAARSQYSTSANRYPPDLTREIQAKVGAVASGKMDDATIQAIAAYQQANGLTPADGVAGARTLTAMFGGDVRMRPDAGPSALVDHDDLSGVWREDVQMTQMIHDAWKVLYPHLPRGAVITSGLRSWAKSAELIIYYFNKKLPTIKKAGLITDSQARTLIDTKNYKQMYDWCYDTRGGMKTYYVAMPGQSRHCTGKAFDISGASLSAIAAAVKQAAAKVPEFGAVYKKLLVESEQNCIHVDLK